MPDEARVTAIASALELDADQVVPVSAKTGLGRDDLATAVMELVVTHLTNRDVRIVKRES